ncbi:uncharacterized protein BDV14DRAFT_175471 [Aspergillus stella-maris]|uniref:uncharacterized protein n=1 Tax=Aspergillus stella-maris TaxID=1810926 RepID=UPI003CCCCF40
MNKDHPGLGDTRIQLLERNPTKKGARPPESPVNFGINAAHPRSIAIATVPTSPQSMVAATMRPEFPIHPQLQEARSKLQLSLANEMIGRAK